MEEDREASAEDQQQRRQVVDDEEGCADYGARYTTTMRISRGGRGGGHHGGDIIEEEGPNQQGHKKGETEEEGPNQRKRIRATLSVSDGEMSVEEAGEYPAGASKSTSSSRLTVMVTTFFRQCLRRRHRQAQEQMYRKNFRAELEADFAKVSSTFAAEADALLSTITIDGSSVLLDNQRSGSSGAITRSSRRTGCKSSPDEQRNGGGKWL